MQRRGAIKKGFLLVVIVILAAAFFASYFNDASGYATKAKLQRFAFVAEESSGESGPTNVQPCGLTNFCKPACLSFEDCVKTGGTNLNPQCGCVPNIPGRWVDTGRNCGTFRGVDERYGGNRRACTEEINCGPNEKCEVRTADFRKGDPCNCYRFEETPVSTF